MDQVAPRVLNRRQNRLYRIEGKFADAATANARATRKAMLSFWLGIANAIAMPPMTKAAIRATLTSWCSETLPCLKTLAYRSCATLEALVRVSPATTARIVAKPTAEMSARRTAPPVEP